MIIGIYPNNSVAQFDIFAGAKRFDGTFSRGILLKAKRSYQKSNRENCELSSG